MASACSALGARSLRMIVPSRVTYLYGNVSCWTQRLTTPTASISSALRDLRPWVPVKKVTLPPGSWWYQTGVVCGGRSPRGMASTATCGLARKASRAASVSGPGMVPPWLLVVLGAADAQSGARHHERVRRPPARWLMTLVCLEHVVQLFSE